MFSEEWIEGVCKIANSKPLVDKYQGNILRPEKVEKWHVKQVLEANILLQDEWLKEQELKSD